MGIIAFDPNLLLSWAQLKAGDTGSSSSSTSSSSAATPPTPPWANSSSSSASSASSTTKTSSKTSTPALTATAKAVLSNASKFINPNAAKLSVASGSTTKDSDYRNLFALYQGLDALHQFAQQMSSSSLSSFEKAALQKRFAQGMQEVQSFLGSASFNNFQMAQGKSAASAQSTTGAPVETDAYTGSTVYSGAMGGAVPAFQGTVQFALTATKASGAQVQVSFDFSEMGSAPRTVASVLDYMNGKLKDAGLATRFGEVFTPGTAQTVQAGNKTVNIGTSASQWALKIVGNSAETISLSAATASPAVYVAQTSGDATGSSPDAVQQLIKHQTDPAKGDQVSPTDRISQATLGPEVQAVGATATAPDGSLYVLANVTAATSDGQTLQGPQDVALMKYDSAGQLVYTRTLGAAGGASGYALSVSADGSKVAVAGAASGVLAGTTTPSESSVSNTFVSVYSAAGDEQWTQRGGSAQGDQPSSVAFGADGSVYVAGKTISALPGATSQGSADGYLKAFSATGVQAFATEFGTSGQDGASGVAVSGSSVYVAGVENGDAVVRRYDLQSAGAPTLAATRDLGSLQGGNIAGVAVNADGSVVVAGSTHSGSLSSGSVTQAFQSGKDAFVATLQPDLAASGSDSIAYLRNGGDTTASKMTLSDGQVYLTGTVSGAPTSLTKGQASETGFAMQVDPAAGSVGWRTAIKGLDGLSNPSAIAVASAGASVLDQLGLPQGTIAYAKSELLVSNTSLRAGDKFTIKAGSSSLGQTVTIEATDTLQTLAQKVQRASGYEAVVTVLPVNGETQIKIAPLNSRMKLQLTAGPQGQDALGPLGLVEGVLTKPATTSTSSSSNPTSKPTFSLNLSSTLSLDNPSGAGAAATALQKAMNSLQSAYTLIAYPTTTTKSSSGAVPAYITNRIADYTAALNRLTSSSG